MHVASEHLGRTRPSAAILSQIEGKQICQECLNGLINIQFYLLQ